MLLFAQLQSGITDEDYDAIVIARLDALGLMEVLNNSRLFQLELLYTALENGDPTDSIIEAIAILNNAVINQRKLYTNLVNAQDAINALSGNPPFCDAQQIFKKQHRELICTAYP